MPRLPQDPFSKAWGWGAYPTEVNQFEGKYEGIKEIIMPKY